MRRSFNRICAVGLITFATLITITVWLDSPAARARNDDRQHTSAALLSSTDVSIIDFAFNPQVITITAGSTVTWTNLSPITTHTVTKDGNELDRHDLGPGGVFTRTFTVPGSFFDYHCSIHPFMAGAVVVIQPPVSVNMTGPSDGAHGATFVFSAKVNPISTTLPITYLWQATGQSSATHAGGGLSDTIAFSWTAAMTGAQWITVTASNAGGSAGGTHLLIINPRKTYLPLIFK